MAGSENQIIFNLANNNLDKLAIFSTRHNSLHFKMGQKFNQCPEIVIRVLITDSNESFPRHLPLPVINESRKRHV